MKMVERIARALSAQLLKTDCGFEMTDAEAQAMALAALKAMREPNDRMCNIGSLCAEHQLHDLNNDDVSELFTAMIDAAIKEAEAE